MPCIACTLSRRQWEFLKLAAVGASDRQIAAFLYVSRDTVRTYFKQLFSYTGFHSRVQVALWAQQFL